MTGTNPLDAGTLTVEGGYVSLRDIAGMEFGGPFPGQDNVLGGPTAALRIGTYFWGSGESHENWVETARIRGNRIGIGLDDSPLPGTGPGILVGEVGNGVIIGGDHSKDANIIAHREGPGIHFTETVIEGAIAIFGNSIHSNGGLGIDLGEAGEAGNDPLDLDEGPSGLQNSPTFVEAQLSNGVLSLSGYLLSSVASQFRVEFFASSQCSADVREGEFFIGKTNAFTDPAGFAPFSVDFKVGSMPAEYITATATRMSPGGSEPAGGTSEFSHCFSVGEAIVIPVATADGVTLEETTPGEANAFANNYGGIRVAGYHFEDVAVILGNTYVSTGRSIDVGESFHTPNDPLDADEGPNHMQNFPVLESAVSGESSLMVTGLLNSVPDHTYRIQLYSATECHSTGYGPGEQYLGFEDLSLGGGGEESFEVSLEVEVPTGAVITATASRWLAVAGLWQPAETSEFSACVVVE